MTGLLDRLSPQVRHLVLILVTAALVYGLPWVEANYTTWQIPPVLIAAIGAVLPYASLWLSKVNGQYGRGASDGSASATVDALPDVAAVETPPVA